MARVNQITVTTGGTRVPGDNTKAYGRGYYGIKALTTNTGVIYMGESDVATTNGYPLSAGQEVVMELNNLNELYFDASANSQKVAWVFLGSGQL